MWCWAHNPLWEAAKLWPPLEVPGWDWTDLEHCRSGGTLLSCRQPDFQGTWPDAATSQDGGEWSLGWPHCGGLQAALPHFGRAVKQRLASPHCPGGEREASVLPHTSLIGTGNASRAYPFEIPHLCQPRLVRSMTGCHPLRLSPWEQVCQSEQQESPEQKSEWQESPRQESEWQESPWQETPWQEPL